MDTKRRATQQAHQHQAAMLKDKKRKSQPEHAEHDVQGVLRKNF